MTAPDVSVVVPTLDGRAHVETLIESLREQTFPRERFEIVVVDNGSTDGTAAFLREHHPDVALVRNESNRGFAAATNRGAERARGRLVALVNNDMRLQPQWLERMTDALDRSGPDVVCVSSRIESWDGTHVDFTGGSLAFNGMGYQDTAGAAVGSADDRPAPSRLLFPCGGAMIVDRAVYRSLGGLDERFFAYYEDVDFGWRAWVLGYEVAFCADAVAYHRGGGTGSRFPLHRRLALLERNALYAAFKNYDDESLAAILPAALLLAVKRVAVSAGVPRTTFEAEGGTGAEVGLQRAGRAALRSERARKLAGRVLPTGRRRALGAQTPSRATTSVPLDAYAGVAAIDAFVDELPSLRPARAWIQERRRRTDAEIFGLFPPRLTPEYDHPDYAAAYRNVLAGFRVAETLEQRRASVE
jgi:GT2 family glycosyltransferase